MSFQLLSDLHPEASKVALPTVLALVNLLKADCETFIWEVNHGVTVQVVPCDSHGLVDTVSPGLCYWNTISKVDDVRSS